MKYWLYFVAKLLAATGFMWVLQDRVLALCPVPPDITDSDSGRLWMETPLTIFVFVLFLTGVALLALIVWDQRRRCRSCLRPLIMPVASGSWSRVVLGRPQTAWICRYGHGTLIVEDLQITGRQLPGWQPHDDDIWKELESYYQARK